MNKKNNYYHIDDKVTSGVTLHSVYPDYVLLARAGRTEKLSLPKASDKGFSTQAGSVSRTSLTVPRNSGRATTPNSQSISEPPPSWRP